MSDFNQRLSLTQILSSRVRELFSVTEVEIIPFGFENIAKHNDEFNKFMQSPRSNFSHSSMLIKFAPDFVMLKKTEPKEIYFLEIKASTTPLYSISRLNEIKLAHREKAINLSDVGDIAREAWNAYKTLYPNTIILDACSYNPKLVMAQFVDKIDCLRCYKDQYGGYNCAQCPVANRGFFEYSRNVNSTGSQTPHTNIDYSSMLRAEDFFDSIGISINAAVLQEIRTILKEKGATFGYKVTDWQKENIKNILREEGCNWL